MERKEPRGEEAPPPGLGGGSEEGKHEQRVGHMKRHICAVEGLRILAEELDVAHQ